MMRGWYPRLIVAVVLIFRLFPADAAIVDVSPQPSRANAGVTSATLNIVWQVQRVDQPNTSANVVSQSGQFLLGGSVVQTVSRPLSRVFPGNATGNEIATFSEAVNVPRSILVEAARSGQSLTYQRSFTDGTGASAGSVTVAVVGSAGGEFAITRIELKFEGDSRVRVLPGDETIRALAEINFGGSGILRGVWEIAGPASTTGEPLFRPLTIVRRNLAGGDRVIISSPQLPTDTQGLHVVRLRIEEPALDFVIPVLRYFVTAPESEAAPPPPTPVQLQAPAGGAVLAPDSEFTWEPLPGAQAYMLQFYPAEGPAEPTAPPVAAVLVPGERQSTVLEALTWQRLEYGTRYRWRIRAMAEDGSLAGLSGWREILTPARGAAGRE